MQKKDSFLKICQITAWKLVSFFKHLLELNNFILFACLHVEVKVNTKPVNTFYSKIRPFKWYKIENQTVLDKRKKLAYKLLGKCGNTPEQSLVLYDESAKYYTPCGNLFSHYGDKIQFSHAILGWNHVTNTYVSNLFSGLIVLYAQKKW